MYNSITVFANAKPTNHPKLKFNSYGEMYAKISELEKQGYNRNTSIEKGKGYFDVCERWLTITLMF